MLENAGRIALFSFRYEKVNKTDSLQPSGCSLSVLTYLLIALFWCSIKFIVYCAGEKECREVLLGPCS